MTRISHNLGMLLLVAFAGTLRAEEAKPQPKQIKFQYRLFEEGADGKRKILSEPTLITIEGTQATLVVGGETVVTDLDGKKELVPHGIRLEVRGKIKDDRIDLDLSSSVTTVGDGAEGKVWDSRTTRLRTRAQLGKTLKIELPGQVGGTKTWAELTAEVVAPAKDPQPLPGFEIRPTEDFERISRKYAEKVEGEKK